MKQQYVKLLEFSLFCIMEMSTEIWSSRERFFLKPFCSAARMSSCSQELLIRLARTAEHSLATVESK